MKMKKTMAHVIGAGVTVIGMLLIYPAGQPVQARADAENTAAAIEENADKKAKKMVWQAPDQEAARERAGQVVPFVAAVVEECLLCRQQKLRELGLSTKDIPDAYFLLDSPIIRNREDHYGPVRFMHAKHAAEANDCAVCHHYRPADPAALETTRCSACHQEAFKADHPERVGLKAAYHMQCIDCHQKQNKGPVDCIGCHAKNVPDHKDLVKLPENPAPEQVSGECLRCHKQSGEDMLTSAHWLWKGHSPYTMEHRKNVVHGKATTAFNNY